MDEIHGKEIAKQYYDQESETYIHQYNENFKEYPANLVRINLVIERLKKNNVKTVLDCGCGSCGPMIKMLDEGFKVKGFDFSEKMINQGKKELEKANYDPDLIYQIDLEDEFIKSDEKFDAVVALGVFPHLLDENKVLLNLRKKLNKNGLIFIEFRNDLFAIFSSNNYSFNFYLNEIVDKNSLPDDVLKDVVNYYSDMFKITKIDKISENNKKIHYTDGLAKLHNPLNIDDKLFKPTGFSLINNHFYHYHALPPIFEKKYPELFIELSLKLEKPNDWRGNIMASAFVVEARKDD